MLGTWPALPVALAPRPSALDLVVVELWARWERQLMEEVDPSVICNHDKLVFIQRAVRHWMGKRRHRPSSSRPTSAWPLDIDSLSKNSIPRATPAVVTGLVTSRTHCLCRNPLPHIHTALTLLWWPLLLLAGILWDVRQAASRNMIS